MLFQIGNFHTSLKREYFLSVKAFHTGLCPPVSIYGIIVIGYKLKIMYQKLSISNTFQYRLIISNIYITSNQTRQIYIKIS